MKKEYEVWEKVDGIWRRKAWMKDREDAMKEIKWFRKKFTHRTFRLVKIETIEEKVSWWVEIGCGENGWTIDSWNVFDSKLAAGNCAKEIYPHIRKRIVEVSTVRTRRVVG